MTDWFENMTFKPVAATMTMNKISKENDSTIFALTLRCDFMGYFQVQVV